MGRTPKKAILKRRETDGQQTHEKMLNTIHYYRNANQNYNEVSPHTGQNGHHQSPQKINARDGVEEREPSYTVGRHIN